MRRGFRCHEKLATSPDFVIELLCYLYKPDSYNAGLFNKRGFTSRGPYDGGGIERGNAELFKSLYEKYNKKYQRVSKVFKDLWAQYERMAKEMDDEADITKLDY